MVALTGYKTTDKIPLVCDFCEHAFQRVKKDVQRNIRLGRKFYCSKNCSNLSKIKKTEKTCFQCLEAFVGNSDRKFCSKNCSAGYNNSLRERKASKKCRNCNTDCSKVYCSAKCQQEHQYKIFIEAWLSGKDTGVRGSGLSTSSRIKKYLIELHGNKCSQCGWKKVHSITGKVPIQLDHKDGNAENNQISNLRLLCPNCHSLTSTYGGLNRGKGRKNRYAVVA